MKIRIKYIVEDTDRHGTVRLYYRRNGCPKVRLPPPIGGPEFLAAYKAAASTSKADVSSVKARSILTGSMRALCVQYFQSAPFLSLDARTQKVRRAVLERFCQHNDDGDKPVSMLLPRHIRKRRDEMMDRPEAANGLLKALRQVFNYALDYDLADRNPAKDVPYLASKNPDGFHSWTLEEIGAFEERHPLGTMPRLALALLLYTVQRRSDVVLFGRQHVQNGRLVFTQVKNQKKKPVRLEIMIVPELQRTIDASRCGDMTFIINGLGRPFTANGFGNWFRDRCDEAGLSHCSAHGLRKAAAARLAELGHSEQEIMAVTGHRTSKEVARYTRAASQRIRADTALASYTFEQRVNKSVPLLETVVGSGTIAAAKSLK